MKVVINRCFGGFGLSDAAVERYAELKGINLVKIQEDKSFGGASWYIDGIEDNEHYFSSYSIGREDRADPILVQVVEEMGKAANGWAAELAIVDVPDGVDWQIEEYDGSEHVAEAHRTWC
jgi:MinD superfamily P-loop ATPase